MQRLNRLEENEIVNDIAYRYLIFSESMQILFHNVLRVS